MISLYKNHRSSQLLHPRPLKDSYCASHICTSAMTYEEARFDKLSFSLTIAPRSRTPSSVLTTSHNPKQTIGYFHHNQP